MHAAKHMSITSLASAACLGVSLLALCPGVPMAATTAAPSTAAAAATPAKAVPAKPTVRRKPKIPKAETMPAVVEPGSIQALVKMSAYLKKNPVFEVKMKTQRDEVDDYGQVVVLNGQTDYKIKSPDRLNIDLVDRDKTRRYVYDGKSVTLYDPKTGFYARFPARPTIRQTLDAAAEKYGITLPLDDLFHWDEGDTLTQKITSGHYVGDSTIDGQAVEQYVFRQPGVDWQIWIAKGDKPTPMRVVVIASDDPARPRFVADLTWDTGPQFADDTFVFTPPAESKEIKIVSLAR